MNIIKLIQKAWNKQKTDIPNVNLQIGLYNEIMGNTEPKDYTKIKSLQNIKKGDDKK